MKNPTDLTEWQALSAHQADMANTHMRNLFAADQNRFSHFSLRTDNIFLDYSRNRINSTTIKLLSALAQACGLSQQIEALFTGHPVNMTEKRPALHTALRDPHHTPIVVNGINIATLIADARAKMRHLVTKVHTGEWRGTTGKTITHIVNIGIGGSYLGPMMCARALKDFAVSNLHCHFISSVDKAHLIEAFQQIDPERALFVISSKSFTTLETMTNTKTMMGWMQDKFGPDVISKQFIATTAAPDKAIALGIPEENILPLWDWVGGRYSVWSSIGLPLALIIGNARFDEFLAGAFAMDTHFRHSPFAANLPVLLGLIGIWYLNFFGASVHAIVPYSNRLRYLVPYLQQAEMESNGKSVNSIGQPLPYTTSPVIFGEEGINGQHAYHQLLHQGRHFIPADIILVGKNLHGEIDIHQEILIASGLSQASALMRGKTYDEARSELLRAQHPNNDADYLAHHRAIPGNRPSNILFLEQITPATLGALMALYEHKIFVQSVIWNINPFDQWGIELGKELLPDILQRVQDQQANCHTDPATAGLIHHFQQIRGNQC